MKLCFIADWSQFHWDKAKALLQRKYYIGFNKTGKWNTSGKLPSQPYMGTCSARACKMFTVIS